MAKSSKKQCRPPRAQQQRAGMVVITARHLQAHAKIMTKTGESGRQGKPTSQGRKKKSEAPTTKLQDLDNRNCSTVAGAVSHDKGKVPIVAGTESTKFLFSSTHLAEARLCYLLSVRRRVMDEEGGKHTRYDEIVEGGCHVLVITASKARARATLCILKAMTFAASAIHERTPKAQAQDYVKRFVSTPSHEKSSVLVMTDATLAQTSLIRPVPPSKAAETRVVYLDAARERRHLAARERLRKRMVCSGSKCHGWEEIFLEDQDDAACVHPFPYDVRVLGRIQSRVNVAKKLAVSTSLAAGESDARGMRKAASTADLVWDGSDNDNDNDNKSHRDSAESTSVSRRRAHVEQARAYRDKLNVLLCQPLLDPLHNVVDTGAFMAKQSTSLLRKKMVILGMITSPELRVTRVKGVPDDRCAAKTRWLDCRPHSRLDGGSKNSYRTGASCDATSLAIRAQVEAAKTNVGADFFGPSHWGAISEEQDRTRLALAAWNPNPASPDEHRWGGRWGKPCGHNEVVLHHLRPFEPVEVINTRVCSRSLPAPGNQGFDGCLEFLCLMCRHHRRAFTLWDDAAFHYVDKTGACTTWPKRDLLCLPLPKLKFVIVNMRGFTASCQGQTSPKKIAQSVQFLAGLAAKKASITPLTHEVTMKVVSYVLSGDKAQWQSLFGPVPGSVNRPNDNVRYSQRDNEGAVTSRRKRKRVKTKKSSS